MEITWNKNIEQINKARVEVILNEWLWLMPTWCQRLHINLTDDDGTYSARVETSYLYRYAALDFHVRWLNETKEEQTLHLVHELAHNFYNPLYWFARDNFDTLLPENESPKYRQTIRDSLTVFNELGTQDLAYALVKKFRYLKEK